MSFRPLLINTKIIHSSHYIGDIIIKNYKKVNSAKQSVWNSDTDRLTYVIRTLLKNNKFQWQLDKKGIDTANHMINPILQYIKTKLEQFKKDTNLKKS